ncbi:MAG: NAD-dependent epimerase/dehydratase family protein [Anaerolineae bacterium]
MAHYLVTGVAGFIASRVVETLLSEGHTVVGLDNLNDAYDVRLKAWRLARLEGQPGFEFRRLDITDLEALQRLFDGGRRTPDGGGGASGHQPSIAPFDAVVNLAARAGVRQSVQDPWIYVATNVTGTLNLLELCRESGVGKFVLASTSSLYGARNPRPFREDADTDGPLSPYAASKKAAEAMCYAYHHLYDLDVTVLRYFTVYGAAGRPDMSIFRFVQWISEGQPVTVYGDGQQSRDFTHVDDIARGTVAGLKLLGYEVINLGSDEPVVLMDVIHQIEALLGKEARLEFLPRHRADVLATWAEISKAERLLGWRPELSFRKGLENAVDWYRANQEWARDVVTR